MSSSIDSLRAIQPITVPDDARTGAAARRRSLPLVALFGATIFVSAFLMFLVQPMIARMVLPLLGGAPAVWNTCLVFFQTLLLCGYAYAHGATTWLGARRHTILHAVVLLLPLLVLPIGLKQATPPPTHNPIGWLLLVLLMSIGLPFFVLSTSAAVLQKWYASTDGEGADDPYFLYAASNMGSFIALIAYPLVVEPTLRLQQQTQLWTAGYAIFVGLALACAASVWRQRTPAHAAPAAPAAAVRAETISWRRRAHWTLLAFVPSSLLMAVTTHMSTDVAAVPLMWIVPLALYLLTFVLAFSPTATGVRALANRLMPLGVVALTLVLVAQVNSPLMVIIPLHVLVFGMMALVCHGALANDRPSAARLTEFYLWIAVGGMLGGLFNALVAPVVFVGIVEYPLVIVLACLSRPAEKDGAADARTWTRDVVFALAIGALAMGSVWLNNRLGSQSRLLLLGAALPALLAYSQRRRPLRFAASVAILLVSGAFVAGGFGHTVFATRTFFGVYRVRVDEQLQQRFMFHGTTLHGMQSLSSQRSREPLSYFHRTGPLGQVFAAVPAASQASQVAVAGLGVGSIASYAGPSQQWTYYEIDPAVERIARENSYFTYLRDCGSRCVVITGDARLSMQQARPQQFGLIILDAFSSDAIPMHLLTREAMSLYLSKLAPGGAIAMNVSNVHLSIYPVVARVAQEDGLAVLWQREPSTAGSFTDGKFPSEWMVMARNRADFGSLTSDPRWVVPVVPPSTRLWTDDFSNILSVIRH
jgi:hypothetical protein